MKPPLRTPSVTSRNSITVITTTAPAVWRTAFFGLLQLLLWTPVWVVPLNPSTSQGHLSDSNNPPQSLGVGDPKMTTGEPSKMVTPAANIWWSVQRGSAEGPHRINSSVSSTVPLSCEVRGSTPDIVFTIHWLKNGRSLARSSRYREKGFTLRLTDLTVSDSGNYTCHVSTAYTRLSRTFQLVVTEGGPTHLPVITQGPENVTVTEGETARLPCNIHTSNSPDPSLELQWIYHHRVNGAYQDELGNPYTIVIKSASDSSQKAWNLTLKAVTKGDESWYSCVVKNNLGYHYHTAYLHVLRKKCKQSIGTADCGDKCNVVQGTNCWILGGVVGFIALANIITLTFAVRCRRRRKRRRKMEVEHQLVSFTSEGPDTSQEAVSSQEPLRTVVPRACTSSFTTNAATRIAVNRCLFPCPPVTSAPRPEIQISLDPEWEFPRDQLMLKETLGEGAFGCVRRATASGIVTRDSRRLTTVAVKQLKGSATLNEQKDFVQEIEVMKDMKRKGSHANIVNFLGCCSRDGPLLLIVEFCKRGNLRDFLVDCREGANCFGGYRSPEDPCWFTMSKDGEVISRHDLLSFSFQVAQGMEFLASKKCIHRDLALRNVLLTESHTVKIADFGLARTGDYYRKTTRGRLPVKWMAPEALFDMVYNTKTDVWSFGVTLWEIFALGGMPYPSIPNELLYTALLERQYRMPPPELASGQLYGIMQRCWSNSPQGRPDFPQLVRELQELLTNSIGKPDYMDTAQGSKQREPSLLAEAEAINTDQSCEREPALLAINTDQSCEGEPALLAEAAVINTAQSSERELLLVQAKAINIDQSSERKTVLLAEVTTINTAKSSQRKSALLGDAINTDQSCERQPALLVEAINTDQSCERQPALVEAINTDHCCEKEPALLVEAINTDQSCERESALLVEAINTDNCSEKEPTLLVETINTDQSCKREPALAEAINTDHYSERKPTLLVEAINTDQSSEREPVLLVEAINTDQSSEREPVLVEAINTDQSSEREPVLLAEAINTDHCSEGGTALLVEATAINTAQSTTCQCSGKELVVAEATIINTGQLSERNLSLATMVTTGQCSRNETTLDKSATFSTGRCSRKETSL